MHFPYPHDEFVFGFSLFLWSSLNDKSPYCIPEPILSGFISPDSMLVKIERAHLINVSSTFSPLKALHSRNIKSNKLDY
jgi:hypothetical protein